MEEWSAKSDVPVKYLLETAIGAHFARNSSALYSSNEILYFTDDDMIADKDMLVNIVKVFDMDYNIAVAGER